MCEAQYSNFSQNDVKALVLSAITAVVLIHEDELNLPKNSEIMNRMSIAIDKLSAELLADGYSVSGEDFIEDILNKVGL